MIMPSASLPISASFLLRQLLQDNEMAGLPRDALLWLPAQQADPRTPVSWSLKQPLAAPD